MLLGVFASMAGCGSSTTDQTQSPPVNNFSLYNLYPYPTDGDSGVSTAARIRLFLNHDIDEGTLRNGGFVLTGPSPVSGTIIYDPDTREFEFYPDSPLSPYTTYTARFTSDLVDLDGFHLQNDYSWTFTTGPEILRVSLNSQDEQPNAGSSSPSISDDGNVIAFLSQATNLVADDINSSTDIFVRNLVTNETVLASVHPSGNLFDSDSSHAVISGNGRYVVFLSKVYYMRDLQNETTTRVDVIDPMGSGTTVYPLIENYPAVSYDGRYVAFQSAINSLTSDDNSDLRDVFLRDTVSNTTTLISVSSDEVQANHHSYEPSISADGRFVAFYSFASNLVNNDTNGEGDIFVRDVISGTTTRVSVAAAGIIEANGRSTSPRISDDGRYVAFSSEASNLVPGDTNNETDVFFHDNVTGITRRVSVYAAGIESDGASGLADMTADGRYVLFTSSARNWALDGDEEIGSSFRFFAYIHDTQTGETHRLFQNFSNGLYTIYGLRGKAFNEGLYLVYSYGTDDMDGTDTNYTYDVFRAILSAP
mgnify:CR=1 FL=1